MSLRLGGRFSLGREIGSGGMSVVFLGHDEVLDRSVAVKVLKAGLEDDEAVAARFRREGRTAAKLSHPNIVQAYDAGEGELDGREVSFIVMEFVPGGDLKGVVEERGRLTGDELARLGAEVAAGLSHAHDRGIIHRDLKPQNILLDEYGRPKLADFGIARALDSSWSTRTGAYLGTALYSSPEQLRGERTTPKSDVYSLGVTLYFAASGRPPFTGDPLAVANQHVNALPPVPTVHGAEISEDLERVILACLEKNPDDRPTVSEVGERLSRNGEPASPPQPVPSEVKMPASAPATDGTTQGAGPGDAFAGVAAAATREARKRFGAVAEGVAGAVAAPPSDLATVRTFRPERNRRMVLLAAALVLVAVVAAVAIASFASGGGEPAAPEEMAGSLRETAEPPATPASEPEASSNAPEDGGSSEPLPPLARAETAVFDMYVDASYRRFGASFERLSGRLQGEVGSAERWGDRFGEITYVYFTRYPEARQVGQTAEVGFQVRETFEGGARLTTGTWVCVAEDGAWRLDRLENEKTETY